MKEKNLPIRNTRTRSISTYSDAARCFKQSTVHVRILERNNRLLDARAFNRKTLIELRQQAVRDMSERHEFREQFRVMGTVNHGKYPTKKKYADGVKVPQIYCKRHG